MNDYQKKFKAYLDRIAKALPKKTSKQTIDYVRQFYDKMPIMDLEQLDPKLAASIAQTSYDFIQSRTLGEPKIAVHTHMPDEHGGNMERTVIEILGDDMPFLVDSISAELARMELSIHTLIHPVLLVRRDSKGKLLEVQERGDSVARKAVDSDAQAESFMHIQVSHLPEDISAEQLTENIHRVLKAVRYAVMDWKAIMAKIPESLEVLDRAPANFDRDDVEEVKSFLNWLTNNNFIFLGYVEYDFSTKNNNFKTVKDSELGMFKLEDEDHKPKGLSTLPAEVLHFARQPELLEITKGNMQSPVHRPIHMDYISIKRFDKHGDVIGENRFLGLFTSRVYYQSADDIPIIRRKIARTMRRANFDPVSHNGKALKAIMEFFPRDELFQTGVDHLFNTSMGILALDAKPDVRLFVRRDLFERFASCMLYVPRERFSTYLREKVQEILEKAFNGKITAYYTQVTDSPLARVHLIVKTEPGHLPDVNVAEVEKAISKVTNLWSDALMESLIRHYGHKRGERLFRIYKNAFPSNYVTHYGSDSAVFDIHKMDEALESGNLALDLFRKKNDSRDFVRLKVYNPKEQVPLSDILPMLENIGFRVLDENPYLITPRDCVENHVWVRDLRLTMPGAQDLSLSKMKAAFEEALAQVWHGKMENDGFNALVTKAGLVWRDVMLLRAYSKYLKQTGLAYSQDFLVKALSAHPQIAKKMVELFYARFEPKHAKDAPTAESLAQSINRLLANVSNIAEDRVIRRYVNVIESTLRTNFFQKDEHGNDKDYISFKLDSRALSELPLPRPFREIFVYSIRTEGIHLRGGKVARGGLRWSDRHEDFRTEVLGLMKAQMVKNSIIVPVGSKGGFVVKQPPADGGREAFLAEGIECYKTFLRGMLDITDNIVDGKPKHPTNVKRHDEFDPYLVVAADKGTATFSDIANSISIGYNFWLGDAFASGGSVGYDHKKMGITARGAWVSVVRHFREMGKDISKEPFTVMGIGDMSGDVFGNGMLLSKNIELVGAFNHLHIFLDPSPDPAKSFKERERMFKLPRSTWDDYDKKLISKGGGVFARTDKSIPISKEVRNVLGLDASIKTLGPDQLIQAMLKAPVDLLWNGGIGTYVKARHESHEEVGDRTNNSVRINGEDLRAKIVGEGGNLGFTQLGRMEFARRGGRINTDALDNSAGVSCSDHEVNIKIALASAMGKGDLTLKARDKFLATMTDEVAELVLRDNELQNQALSNAEAQGHFILESRARLIRDMERKGLLNRAIEFLPTEEELSERRAKKQGFTRPELAVILAYSKLALYEEILASSLPDDAYFEGDLLHYFPTPMQKKFADEIKNHQLRREIVATVLTNSMVNRVGSAFFYTMAEDNSVATCDVARAFTITRDVFLLRPVWCAIEELTGKVKASVQSELFVETNRFVTHITGWLLRNVPQPIDLSKAMDAFAPGVAELIKQADAIASPALKDAILTKQKYFAGLDVPKDLATRITHLEILASACDIVQVANTTKLPVKTVGEIYFEMGQHLRLGWLRIAADKVVVDSQWDRIALTAIHNDLYDQQRRLTLSVISGMGKSKSSADGVKKWLEAFRPQADHLLRFIGDLESNEVIDFPMLVVALRNVETITSRETSKASAA